MHDPVNTREMAEGSLLMERYVECLKKRSVTTATVAQLQAWYKEDYIDKPSVSRTVLVKTESLLTRIKAFFG